MLSLKYQQALASGRGSVDSVSYRAATGEAVPLALLIAFSGIE
jgi:hypothetical protein